MALLCLQPEERKRAEEVEEDPLAQASSDLAVGNRALHTVLDQTGKEKSRMQWLPKDVKMEKWIHIYIYTYRAAYVHVYIQNVN